MGLMVLTLVLAPGFSVALADEVLKVDTKDSYELDDEVSVKGYTSINENVTVIISKDTIDILTLSDEPNFVVIILPFKMFFILSCTKPRLLPGVTC